MFVLCTLNFLAEIWTRWKHTFQVRHKRNTVHHQSYKQKPINSFVTTPSHIHLKIVHDKGKQNIQNDFPLISFHRNLNPWSPGTTIPVHFNFTYFHKQQVPQDSNEQKPNVPSYSIRMGKVEMSITHNSYITRNSSNLRVYSVPTVHWMVPTASVNAHIILNDRKWVFPLLFIVSWHLRPSFPIVSPSFWWISASPAFYSHLSPILKLYKLVSVTALPAARLQAPQ